jgi:hypothetical protein
MRGRTLLGAGVILIGAACGCSGDDTAPGSAVGKSIAGSGGSGGTAGSLSLGCEALGGGCAGMGGVGGAGGAMQGGTTSGGGATSHAGAGGSSTGGSSTIGGSGAGGSKPAGMCKRASGSDADCADFYADKPQAYACDDAGAYAALNGAHDILCASVSFVTGSRYGACCPP